VKALKELGKIKLAKKFAKVSKQTSDMWSKGG
jgi:hypothetical protein